MDIHTTNERTDSLIAEISERQFSEGMPIWKRPRQKVNDIIREVAEQTGIPAEMLVGESQKRKVVAARWRAIAEVEFRRPDLSSAQIGRYFNRDHSTILTILKKVSRIDRPSA